MGLLLNVILWSVLIKPSEKRKMFNNKEAASPDKDSFTNIWQLFFISQT